MWEKSRCSILLHLGARVGHRLGVVGKRHVDAGQTLQEGGRPPVVGVPAHVTEDGRLGYTWKRKPLRQIGIQDDAGPRRGHGVDQVIHRNGVEGAVADKAALSSVDEGDGQGSLGVLHPSGPAPVEVGLSLQGEPHHITEGVSPPQRPPSPCASRYEKRPPCGWRCRPGRPPAAAPTPRCQARAGAVDPRPPHRGRPCQKSASTVWWSIIRWPTGGAPSQGCTVLSLVRTCGS